MAARFQILGSSSSGNCAFLDTGESKILIDAGFTARRLDKLLREIGESLATLDAVFLTHEHNDHAAGMRGLGKYPGLPVFANRDTAEALQSRLRFRPDWRLFETGAPFRFRDVEAHAFTVPHDAYDPVGFAFRWGEDGDLFNPARSLAWVVDLGYVSGLVRERAQEADILVVEANYDEGMLDADTRRPWATKQRIRSRHGHLSNEATLEMLDSFPASNSPRNVYLAHLSRDCNAVERLEGRAAKLGGANGRREISVVDPAIGIAPALRL